MDLNDSPGEARFRTEVRTFLEAEAPRETPDFHDAEGDEALRLEQARSWQATLATHGYAALTWPEAYGGRGLGPIEQIIWNQELARVGLGLSIFVVGIGMAGPTIIAHGSEAQKRRHLRPMLEGREIWCQLFSEPGAGSDLAAVAARAVRDGDGWVVTGQKTWSSGAHYSDLGILLARTDPGVPKHQGITCFLCDMRAPGVEIRPLRQLNGSSHFCEVFLDGVRIPDGDRLGPEGSGWQAAMTTLMNERMALGGLEGTFRIENLLDLARRCRPLDDATRDEVARLFGWCKALELLNKRVITKLGRGQIPDAESSVMKLAVARILSRSAELGLQLLGPEALERQGDWPQQFLFAPSMHIAGGTDEIQKNVAAERVLGLPREPRLDKNVPFDALRRS